MFCLDASAVRCLAAASRASRRCSGVSSPPRIVLRSEDAHDGAKVFPATLLKSRILRLEAFLVAVLSFDQYSIDSITNTLSPYTWTLARGVNWKVIGILLPTGKPFPRIIIS